MGALVGDWEHVEFIGTAKILVAKDPFQSLTTLHAGVYWPAVDHTGAHTLS